jgi:hypothetical protein
VTPGSYVISVAPFGFKHLVHVGSTGARGLDLSIPPPADVRLRFTDRDSQQPVRTARIQWGPVIPHRVGLALHEIHGATVEGGDDGSFCFRSPAGWIDVAPDADAYYTDHIYRKLSPGRNEFVVELTRRCGILLLFKDCDKRTSVLWKEGVRCESDDGCVRSLSTGPYRPGGGITNTRGLFDFIDLTGPGTYRLSFDALRGMRGTVYDAVPAVELHVEIGQYIEHVVQLKRRG